MSTMDSENVSQPPNRLSFLVAIMTKDYSRAIDLGTSILNRNPNDHHVRKCLSALIKIRKPNKSATEQESSLSDPESDVSTSGSEESDAAGSSNEDTDGEGCDAIIDASVDAEKSCQSRSSKSLADCVRECVSSRTGITDKKLLNFREKMYQVFALKFPGKN